MAIGPPAGWHPDPRGGHQYRFWDGIQWTDHVADSGQLSTDPVRAVTPVAPAEAEPQEAPEPQPVPDRPAPGPQRTGAPPQAARTWLWARLEPEAEAEFEPELEPELEPEPEPEAPATVGRSDALA